MDSSERMHGAAVCDSCHRRGATPSKDAARLFLMLCFGSSGQILHSRVSHYSKLDRGYVAVLHSGACGAWVRIDIASSDLCAGSKVRDSAINLPPLCFAVVALRISRILHLAIPALGAFKTCAGSVS